MTSPSILLGIILSTIYGVLFHLIKNGGLGRLGVYIIFSWLGFWLGQFLADQLNIDFLTIGTIHAGAASIFSWIFIGLAHWLSRIEINQKQA